MYRYMSIWKEQQAFPQLFGGNITSHHFPFNFKEYYSLFGKYMIFNRLLFIVLCQMFKISMIPVYDEHHFLHLKYVPRKSHKNS